MYLIDRSTGTKEQSLQLRNYTATGLPIEYFI